MIKAGDKVEILPVFQDDGDADFEWIAVDDESQGRVTITPIGTGLAIPPQHVVKVEWLRTDDRANELATKAC